MRACFFFPYLIVFFSQIATLARFSTHSPTDSTIKTVSIKA